MSCFLHLFLHGDWDWFLIFNTWAAMVGGAGRPCDRGTRHAILLHEASRPSWKSERVQGMPLVPHAGQGAPHQCTSAIFGSSNTGCWSKPTLASHMYGDGSHTRIPLFGPHLVGQHLWSASTSCITSYRLKTPPGGGGGRGCLGPWPAPADRPTRTHQKNFPPAKNEIYQRGRKFKAEFRYTNFLASDTLPPVGTVG